MWLVRLTAQSKHLGESEFVYSIPGDSADDLLFNGEFKWKHIEAMLERGSVSKVEVDFK